MLINLPAQQRCQWRKPCGITDCDGTGKSVGRISRRVVEVEGEVASSWLNHKDMWTEKSYISTYFAFWCWMAVRGKHHAPAALPVGNNPSTHLIEGWVDARAGLDVSEKRKISYVCRIRTPDRTLIVVPSTMSRLP